MGWDPVLAEPTAVTFCDSYEQTQMARWQESLCSACRHTPGECAFLPQSNPALYVFHKREIAYKELSTCDHLENP